MDGEIKKEESVRTNNNEITRDPVLESQNGNNPPAKDNLNLPKTKT
jgi:hypothetical protein